MLYSLQFNSKEVMESTSLNFFFKEKTAIFHDKTTAKYEHARKIFAVNS